MPESDVSPTTNEAAERLRPILAEFGKTGFAIVVETETEMLAMLDAALATERRNTRPDVLALWPAFLEWEGGAAKVGSGLTSDQRIGAMVFRDWLAALLDETETPRE